MEKRTALEKLGFKIANNRAMKPLNSVYTMCCDLGKPGFRVIVEAPGQDRKVMKAGQITDTIVKAMVQEIAADFQNLIQTPEPEQEKPDQAALGNLAEAGFENVQDAKFEEAEPPKKPEPVPVEEKERKWGKPAPKRSQPPAVRAMPENVMRKQVEELSMSDIKQYICPKATDQEAFMFLQLCQARNLNPFTKEAYLVKYGSDATMIVGKDAFTRRAEEHPHFDGFKAGVIVQNGSPELEYREGTFVLENEKILGGWAEIYRGDRQHPFKSTVTMKEYSTGKSLWNSKPGTMIRKVALVQGLREAFPSEFAGMYDSSEMGAAL